MAAMIAMVGDQSSDVADGWEERGFKIPTLDGRRLGRTDTPDPGTDRYIGGMLPKTPRVRQGA